MPRDLPPIHQLNSAVGMEQQRCQQKAAFLPRGMTPQRTVPCPRPRRNPANEPVYPAFQEVLDGYLATRFVEVAEDAAFLDRWKTAELAELRAAETFEPGSEFKDGTLPPRRCSAVLLLPGTTSATESGRHALNAFANLASGKGCETPTPAASVVRCAALADVDADLFLKGVSHEMPDGVGLAVRWLKGDAVVTRVYDVGRRAFHEAQGRIKDILFEAKHGENAPVDEVVFASRSPEVESDFQTLQAELHRGFFALQETEVNRVQQDARLVPCNVFVRLIQRPRDETLVESTLAHRHAIHGMLLCDAKGRGVVEKLTSGDERLPLCEHGLDECGIHIVGVHAEAFLLRRLVTLFAARGTPGASLYSDTPGTWMWRFEVMAVPYTLQFSRDWLVQPCTPAGTNAGHPQLRPAQTHLLDRAAKFAARLLSGRSAADAASAPSPSPPPCLVDAADADAAAAATPTGWLTSALCLGLQSSRTTLGDLSRHLRGVSHFREFEALVHEATLRFGTDTSLPDAFARTTKVLKAEAHRSEEASSQLRMWQRVATGAKEVGVRAASPAPVRKVAVSKVLSFLDFCACATWTGSRRILEEMKALVGAETLPVAIQQMAESYAARNETTVKLLVNVVSCYVEQPTPILVLDKRGRVILASCAGRAGTYHIGIGDVFDLAVDARRLFLVDHKGGVVFCRPMTDEERDAKKAKRKAAEGGAATAAGKDANGGEKRSRPKVSLVMPRVPNPDASVRKWKEQAREKAAAQAEEAAAVAAAAAARPQT